MSRYIDADALKDKITNIDGGCAIDGTGFDIYTCEVFELIDEVQTADAVEVVRCKDCKYMCHYTDGHLECRLLSDLKPIPTTYCRMNEDDFCSYGERREQ